MRELQNEDGRLTTRLIAERLNISGGSETRDNSRRAKGQEALCRIRWQQVESI